MSGKVLFDPTSDKWVLSDGEHYLEVPYWAREIIADEFERETRQLKTENDKLQNDADLLRAMWSQERTEKRCHMADNAKLRELCEDMLSCIEIQIAFDRTPKKRMYKEFAGRARELGIEVDG